MCGAHIWIPFDTHIIPSNQTIPKYTRSGMGQKPVHHKLGNSLLQEAIRGEDDWRYRKNDEEISDSYEKNI